MRARLASLGLKVTGRNSELRARLQAALEGGNVSSEEESDDESDNEEDERDVIKHEGGTRAMCSDRNEYRQKAGTVSVLSFKDVEDALELFSGDKGENVERWFESFEEVADTCMWSDGQKAVYARKLLRGSAKIFASFECHARTWHELKKGLIGEFSRKSNSRQVHQKLSGTRKKSDEACLAYMYRMLEIASHADIEEEVKVEYIIDGIIDEEVHKSMLYGAASIKELRKRLIAYEEQKSRRTKSVAELARVERNSSPNQGESARKTRCYNCGDKAHVSADFPNGSRGPKCFKCREYGHVASKCSDLGKSSKEVCNTQKSLRAGCKSVRIGNCELSGLIDTGSELTLMRADQHAKIGAPKLIREIIEFRSIGSENNLTLGKFSTDIVIDDELYHITVHVVPNTMMHRSLIIGTDFLDTVEMNRKRGDISIFRLKDENPDGIPEVFKVDIETGARGVDLSHVENVHRKQAVESLIRNYRPQKTREVGIKCMTIFRFTKGREDYLHKTRSRSTNRSKCGWRTE